MELVSPETAGHEVLLDMAASGGRPHEMTSAQLSRTRRLLSTSLYDFAWHIAGAHDLDPSFHKPVCEVFERWGLPATPTSPSWKRLMVQLPRGGFKSTLLTVCGPLWLLVRNPAETIAIFNASLDTAKIFMQGIDSVVRRSELFEALWGELLPPGISPNDPNTLPKAWPFNTERMLFQRDTLAEKEVSISAFGIGAAAAGHHFTRLIFDDLISEEAAGSQTVMAQVKDWFDNSLYLGPSPEALNGLIACTRWRFDDVYEYARKKHGYRLYRRAALEKGESTFPSRWSTEYLLAEQERDPYKFCTPAETPITMEDWTTKPISLVQVGDVVVGMVFGEKGRFDRLGRRRLVEAKIIDKGNFLAEVFQYELEDGSFVRCTGGHQWLRNKRGYGPLNVTSRGGRQPSCLMKVHDTAELPEELRDDANWLSGFYDGEGSVSGINQLGSGGFILLAQSDKNADVQDRTRRTLTILGFDWKEGRVLHSKNNPKHWDASVFRILGGIPEKARFLRWCRPTRTRRIIGTLYSGRSIASKPKVVSRQSLGIQRVYWLHTETGNYIAWGCVSKNSIFFQNTPAAGRDQSFQPAWRHPGHVEDTPNGEAFVIDKSHYSPDRHALTADDLGFEPDRAPRTVPLHTMTKTLLVDPAPSTDTDRRKEPNARTAMVMMGLDAWGRRFLLDLYAGREEPIETCRRMLRMLKRWGTTRLGIEEVVFSKIYAPFVRYIAQREFPGLTIHYLPLSPGRRDKETRVSGLMSYYEAGLVYLNTPVMALHAEEYLTHPYSSTKDILDAESYANDPGVLPRPESPGEIGEREDREMGYGEGAEDRGVTGYGD